MLRVGHDADEHPFSSSSHPIIHHQGIRAEVFLPERPASLRVVDLRLDQGTVRRLPVVELHADGSQPLGVDQHLAEVVDHERLEGPIPGPASAGGEIR